MTIKDMRAKIDQLVNTSLGRASEGMDTTQVDREVRKLEEELRHESDRQRGAERTDARDRTGKDRDARPEHENTKTTAELRREIANPDYDKLDTMNERATKQLDALEKAGVHRVEAWEGKSPHVVIGDAHAKLAREQAEAEKREEIAQLDRQTKEGAKADVDTGRERTPEPSTSAWAREYEIARGKDGAVVYSRDGEEHIRDHGRDVEVRNDPRAIRDAVTLCKEQGSEKIAVRSTDPEKRQAIMREAYRQGVQIDGVQKPEVAKEYAMAVRAVMEKERIAQQRAEPGQEPRNERGPDISM